MESLGGELTAHHGCALLGPMLVAGLQLGGHVLHRPAGAAVEALLNVGAEGFQLGGAEFALILKDAEAVADHLAGAGVAALLDLALDELLEMLPDDIARRHGDLPVAWPWHYQRLIAAAMGLRQGLLPRASK